MANKSSIVVGSVISSILLFQACGMLVEDPAQTRGIIITETTVSNGQDTASLVLARNQGSTGDSLSLKESARQALESTKDVSTADLMNYKAPQMARWTFDQRPNDESEITAETETSDAHLTATSNWAWSDLKGSVMRVDELRKLKLASDGFPGQVSGQDPLYLGLAAFVETGGNHVLLRSDSLWMIQSGNDLVVERLDRTNQKLSWTFAGAFATWTVPGWNTLEMMMTSDSLKVRINQNAWRGVPWNSSNELKGPGRNWCFGCDYGEMQTVKMWLDLLIFGSQDVGLSSSSNAISSGSSSSSMGQSSAQSSSSQSVSFGSLTDSRDGQVYPTVVIGTQTWMAKNLNYGSMITTTGIVQKSNEKYCYNHLESECDAQGGLYQWQAAMDLPDACQTTSCSHLVQVNHQGICPAGWHIPTRSEFQQLISTLGGSVAGTKMKVTDTEFSLWNTQNNDGNSSGFSAYPNGLLYYEGSFIYHGQSPHYISSTEWSAQNHYRYGVDPYVTELVEAFNHEKWDAMTVRCVKN